FTFMFLFLLECPFFVCLPYTDGFHSVGKTTSLPGNEQSQTPRNIIKQPRSSFVSVDVASLVLSQSKGLAGIPTKPMNLLRNRAVTPHRPAIFQVILVTCVAFGIAVICGIIFFYITHRMVKAEERQQFTLLYENVQIPLLGDQEGSEDSGPEESTHLLLENEKELGNFTSS
ncbi:hypothetical protein GW7_05608, partial [Heterocephalus glaber]